MFDLPSFAITELGLRGLSINASQLVGLGKSDLERIRDRADKASCPVLMLNEDKPLSFSDPSNSSRDQVLDRIRRLGMAAPTLERRALLCIR